MNIKLKQNYLLISLGSVVLLNTMFLMPTFSNTPDSSVVLEPIVLENNEKGNRIAAGDKSVNSVNNVSNTSNIPDLITDRPDFTEASIVAPTRSLQIENGLTYENGGDGNRTFNAPETLLRLGLTKRTEFRLRIPQYFVIRGLEDASGIGDLYVGSKIQLGPLLGGFEAALIPALNIPVGADNITSGQADPELKATWSHELGEKWSIAGMFAFFWPSEDGRHNFTFQPTLSLAYAFNGRLGMFTEYAGEFPERGGSVNIIHQGFTYSISPRQQLDIHYGIGFSGASPDYFIAGGYSFRLDNLF